MKVLYIGTPATTGFQQLRVARRGETRKKTALSAPYTHPRTVLWRRHRKATSRLVIIDMHERENTQQATAQPQGEDLLVLGEDVPRVPRVMAHEGPTHTTLFGYASGKVKQPNVLVERYVQQAIEKVTAELSQR